MLNPNSKPAAAALLQPRIIRKSLDGSIVAVHKPPGMPFHSMDDRLGLLGTLRSSSSLRDSDPAAALEPQQRLYALHRLDTGTSGLVLFATSREVAGLVAKAFRERRVHKYYFALSTRSPKKKQVRQCASSQLPASCLLCC